MRIYYDDKGKILATPRAIDPLPEDSPKTAINVPFFVIEVDEDANRELVFRLLRNKRGSFEQHMPDQFIIVDEHLTNNDTGKAVIINPNPQAEALKASPLYGKTRAEVEAMVDAAKDLAELKAIVKAIYTPVDLVVREVKLAEKTTSYLVRHSRLEG